jgi:hypothetical protein
MENEIKRLKQDIELVEKLFSTNSIINFEEKSTPLVWSKKEILGHLIDSALNNLQRYTEIQFSEKPYIVKSYNPDALVIANNYQNKDKDALFQLWLQLNKQLVFIIQNLSADTLKLQLILPNQETKDLKFLISDYIDHLEHHLNQLKNE